MQAFLSAWAGKYDDAKYPKEFYFDSLVKIQQADSPEVLAESIIGMLHWKDGKVRHDNKGLYCLNDKKYTLSTTKPNTYISDKHNRILESREFYIWVKSELSAKGLIIQNLKQITSGGFRLWEDNSLVMPIFLLHILSPDVYPIYDQHVERAKRVLTGQINKLHTGLTPDDYIAYREFFNSCLYDIFEAQSAGMEQSKLLDEALWAFGKWLKNYLNCNKVVDNNTLLNSNSINDGYSVGYTPNNEFKNRVLLYINQGVTQPDAMIKASDEFGVKLKDSYYLYPGSHISRWRKQVL